MNNPYKFLSEYISINNKISEKVKSDFLLHYEFAKDGLIETFKNYYIGYIPPILSFEIDNIDEDTLTFHLLTKPFPSLAVHKANGGQTKRDYLDAFSGMSSTSNTNTLLDSFILSQKEQICPFTFPHSISDSSSNIWYYIESKTNYLGVLQLKIEERVKDAKKTLNQEFSNSSKQNDFISSVLKELSNDFKCCKNSSVGGVKAGVNSILLGQFKETLEHIKYNYVLHIGLHEISVLEQLLAGEETVKSFRYNRTISPAMMKAGCEALIETGLIDQNTSPEQLCDLFKGKDMSTYKINWIGGKMALCTFILDLLNSKKGEYIECARNEHWAITASCFLLNNSVIERKELLNSKRIANKNKFKGICEFIKNLP